MKPVMMRRMMREPIGFPGGSDNVLHVLFDKPRPWELGIPAEPERAMRGQPLQTAAIVHSQIGIAGAIMVQRVALEKGGGNREGASS
jgi:hypothetical protein